MESLYILVPISVVLVMVIALVFWWCTQEGQFDDLDGPAYQVIMDEDRMNVNDRDARTVDPSASKNVLPLPNHNEQI